MKLYTREDVEEIFEENAIVMSWYEAVPERKVLEIFGEEAWDHVDGLIEGTEKDILVAEYVDDHFVEGLTHAGLWLAASYCNAAELIRQELTSDLHRLLSNRRGIAELNLNVQGRDLSASIKDAVSASGAANM